MKLREFVFELRVPLAVCLQKERMIFYDIYIYIYDIHITGYQIRMTLLSKIRLAAGLRGKFTQRKLLERYLCTGHFGVPSDRTET